MVASYYQLTKPGIIRGNLFTTAGGFFLAAAGSVDVVLLLSTLLGTAFIIASGCVFNNYIDRGIDSQMTRTKKRALVTGKISSRSALLYGSILGIIGLLILLIFTNFLTTRIAIAGFIFYVVLYGYFKRRSIYGTLVGSVSGAIPPVIGYSAVTNTFDIGAILLFLILASWQMPHFYAIGIYRLSEYKKANLPILSVVKSVHLTKLHIVLFIVAFMLFSSLLTLFRYTGFIYLVVMIFVGGAWLYKGIKGFEKTDSDSWAREIFSFSLVVLLVFCILISIDFALPF